MGANLGQHAVHLLLDVRKTRPDAIVCSTDSIAIDVTNALFERGMHVPDELAVTGFDDLAGSQMTSPPLTTVAQPWRRMGKRAVELVLAQLGGDPVPAQMVVPCALVVRESCGCWPRSVVETGAPATPELTWAMRRERVLAQLGATLVGGDECEGERAAARLVDALSALLLGDDSTALLREVRQNLQTFLSADEPGSVWQSALTVLRRHVLGSPDVRGEARHRAESILDGARMLVCEMAVRAQQAQALDERRCAAKVERIGRLLGAHFDLGRLSAVAARELPELGVPALYVCLYEESVAPSAWGRLVAGFNGEGPLELEYEGRRFRLRDVLPQGLLKKDSGHTFLLEPLGSAGQQLGYALFEADPAKSAVCVSVSRQLSEALRGTLLLRQTERDALQLQTAAEVGRAVSSLLQPDLLVQTVVDLVLERLGLYYAGLFLVEEDEASTGGSTRWATLVAGTGQAGARMLAQGHRLEVGGPSMVGQCIAQGKARIALDADKEAMRFDNPLLPYTRSELALPLVRRDKPIGAMTIQSAEAGAFSTQDVAALQIMADQLANAIETARLYARTREALRQTQNLYETSRALSSSRGELATVQAVLHSLSHRSACVYAALFHVDRSSDRLQFLGGAWRGEPDAFPEWLTYPRSFEQDGLIANVCQSGATRIARGWDERIDPRHYVQLGVQQLVRVFAPVRRREETIGVVELGYEVEERRTVSEQETERIAAVLDLAAVALENTRLWADTQRSLEDAERLYRASQRVAKARSAADLLRAVMDGVGEKSVDCIMLWVTEPGFGDDAPSLVCEAGWSDTGGSLPWPTGTRLKAAELSPLWTVQEAQEVYVPDLDDDVCLTASARLILRQWDAASAALVPVWSDAGLAGAVLLARRGRDDYHPHDVRRLQSSAALVAVGLERLQLLRRLERRLRREQILREVSERVRSAIDVEGVMRTTVEEASRALGRPAFFGPDGDWGTALHSQGEEAGDESQT
jgi:GAF domain-containing protein